MATSWRLLVSGLADGPRNMAIDEAVLQAVGEGGSPPTLRLYAWQPACLSLGYSQQAAVVDQTVLADQGWGLVRRPTGGRALLHADELTYAIIGPIDHPALAGGVLDSYRRLSAGLVAALDRLGARADPPTGGTLSPEERANPVCFEVPSAYEITIGGRKLVGSAQLRRVRAVLQHGSLPLRGDITRVVRALRFDSPDARRAASERLARHATTLEDVLGRPVGWEEVAQAMTTGFAGALALEWIEGGLSTREMDLAARLEELRRRDPLHALRIPGEVAW
ncbi:MAG TPA: lipoate--protein ligase family protein [Anaerolineales bacterium]|nr:lipoate--protein ligase family protein [Anaerolineales bacterium]